MSDGLPVYADQADRDRATNDNVTSLLVEASAGTGKTKTLVDRLVTLVGEGGVTLPRIAAMTFTEKAAGEMKARLRRELGKAIEASRASGDADRHQNLLEARRDLESAEISTIHSFCARLLRERPVEAGVDPDFTAADTSVAAAMLEEVFGRWLDREARALGSPVHRALEAGAAPAAMLELSRILLRDRTLVEETTLPSDPLAEARSVISALAVRFSRGLDAVPEASAGDVKTIQVRDGLAELRALLLLPLDGLAAWRPATKFHFGHGSRKAFDPELKAFLEACKEDFKALPSQLESLPLQVVLVDLVGSVRTGLFGEIDAEKRRLGILEFDDLLLKARDLLRKSEGVRAYFQERFVTLVVDEFQDTDPVQAEIVLRLTSPEPQDPDDWRDLEPGPGALFLVGDPKQSIYRFRRADVESYRAVRDRFPASDRLSLRTNFRSDPRILSWVNAVLGPAMVEDRAAPWEIGYAPFEPDPDAAAPRTAPRVVYLKPAPPDDAPGPAPHGDDEDEEESPGERIREARAVANLLLERFSGKRPWRDVAVLVLRNSTIDLYQEVFRRAGIPAILEGGQSFYDREETAAVIAALRAIDDPGDAVSTVAVLKSVLFGLSDLDLLEAVEAGGRFDDWSTFPAWGAAGQALALLDLLHRKRHAHPVGETLAELLAARSSFAAMEADAVVNGIQGLANLERLLFLARGLDAEGLSFGEAVDRLVLKLDAAEGEPRAYEEEADAVRLITVHKAKGLEFPVVVLADLGLKTKRPPPDLVYDRAGGEFGVALSFGPMRVRSPGAKRLGEAFRLREKAEEKRVLYVGVTRARDTLVVSWFRHRKVLKSGEVSDPVASSFLGPIAGFEDPGGTEIAGLVEVVEPDVSEPVGEPAPEEAAAAGGLDEALAAAERLLEAARASGERGLRRAGEKPALPAPEPRPEDLAPADRDDEARGRSVRIGIAVHEAMERYLDPGRGLSVGDAVGASTRELVPAERSEADRLVRRLAERPVVARALAARRRFVELPILFRDGSLPGTPLVEGKIDLLFEEDDGFVLVDWKTDRVETTEDLSERRELYLQQLEAYGRGLHALLGDAARVKESLLVFARVD